MRVLVVGGAGYVGGGVTDYLHEMGHETRVYDGLFYEESYRKDVPFIYGDIRDHERLLPQLKWAEVVVWLAALVGDGACSLNPDITEVINQQEVKWMADHFDGRIIFMSTCSVYGAQDEVLDEASPTNPLSVYASTKLAAEQHLTGKNALIFRLGTLFGVSDQFARIRLDLVVNTLVLKAATLGKLTVFGGDQFRPLLHVKDVARAIAQNVGTTHTGTYNLHRQNVRIVDLAYQVRNHFPDTQIEHTPMQFQDARNYRVLSDRASKVLGFNPVVSIDDGIEEVKQLILEGRIRDFDNPRYSNQAFLSKFMPHLQHQGA